MVKKKKLMILIWNMGLGGMQKRIRDIILDMEDNSKDWEVHLVVKYQKPSYFIDEIVAKTQAKIYFYSLSHKKSNSFPSVFWIARTFFQINPDVCLTFLEHLSIIALILKHVFFWRKCRVVLNEGILTTTYLQIYRGKWWKVWRQAMRFFYPLADLMIVPSQACRADLTENFGVAKDKIKIIHNWTLFKPSPAAVVPKYDLIFVGRFEKEKNILAFIPLIKELKQVFPKIKLCLVGEGKLEQSLAREIKRNKLERHFILPGYQSDVRKFLSQAKIFVLPSQNEGLPNVVLEAAMCQLPTVTNCFEGSDEVVRDGENGFVVHSQDEMVARVRSLLEDDKLRLTMGQQAQKWVEENFSLRNQKDFIRALLAW